MLKQSKDRMLSYILLCNLYLIKGVSPEADSILFKRYCIGKYCNECPLSMDDYCFISIAYCKISLQSND